MSLGTLVVLLGAGPVSVGQLDGDPLAVRAAPEKATTDSLNDRGDSAASRSLSRAPAQAPPASDTPQPSASAKPTAPAKPAKPAVPQPVAGLDQRQMAHAKTIVAVGQHLKLPSRAYVIAIATAMQESNLRNLANPYVAQSLRIKNDGTGTDHDSVGLFQQRPAAGWGTVAQLMDPATSARKFYEALRQVPNWDKLPVTVAAQRVQRSAFPNAYAKHQSRAETIVNALTK